MVNSNLGPVLHGLATVHPCQTDNNKKTNGKTTTTTIARPLFKYSR